MKKIIIDHIVKMFTSEEKEYLYNFLEESED